MEKADQNALLGTFAVIILGAIFTLAGSDGGRSIGGLPIFATGVALAFVLQWIAFAPAYAQRTEKYFDLMGSVGFLAAITFAYFASGDRDARGALLFSMVLIWTVRLGFFLVRRISKAGKDGRFDELKKSAPRFFAAWTLQGLWITFTLAAAMAAIASVERKELGALAFLGTLVWLVGFGFEAVADWQKSRFKARPENKGKFIDSGLWRYSRHPNYFGEITLWVGVAIIAAPVLSGWQWLVLSSPVFVAILLIRVSGIPPLEKRADAKWGGDEAYENYKRQTPILVPRFLGGR